MLSCVSEHKENVCRCECTQNVELPSKWQQENLFLCHLLFFQQSVLYRWWKQQSGYDVVIVSVVVSVLIFALFVLSNIALCELFFKTKQNQYIGTIDNL